jgi:hypothetical protein
MEELKKGVSPSSPPTHQQKTNWLQKWIHSISKMLQTDENKKMVQIFLIDPILNHILERIFPYIVIMCVLFVLLTIMITLTLLLVFTRLPGALGVGSLSSS